MTAAHDRFRVLERQPFISTASDSTLAGVLRTVVEIGRRRDLLSLLVRRDLKSRYKDSALGVVWTLIRPLTQLLVYYIVLGQFLGAERGLPQFAIYIFSGLIAYGLFSEIVSSATNSILSNAGLVKKVYLPRAIFPLASVGSALFNFAMQLVILAAATLLLGSFTLHADIVYAIPGLALLLIYGYALGLLLAALNVYFRDIGYLVEVVLLLMLWASPIVYGWSFVRDALGPGPLLEVYTDNPITLAVLAFNKAFWTAGADAAYPEFLLLRIGIALLVGLLFIAVSQFVFARLQGNFAQEL
jgi:ABC-2 type transport system permease protein